MLTKIKKIPLSYFLKMFQNKQTNAKTFSIIIHFFVTRERKIEIMENYIAFNEVLQFLFLELKCKCI